MAKSTAKAESLIRALKDRLELRGFSTSESKDAEGYPKLTIGSDASIKIVQADMVSKDVLGLDLKAFAPHEAELSSIDGMAKADYSKVMLEVTKMGVDKLAIKEGVDLATAEAASPSAEIIFDIRFPGKGV